MFQLDEFTTFLILPRKAYQSIEIYWSRSVANNQDLREDIQKIRSFNYGNRPGPKVTKTFMVIPSQPSSTTLKLLTSVKIFAIIR